MTDSRLQQQGEQPQPAPTATVKTPATEATPATPATPTTQATSGKGRESGKGEPTAAPSAKGHTMPAQGKGKGGLRECK